MENKEGPRKMKVTAFMCSPRQGGNTSLLFDEAVRAVKEYGKAELKAFDVPAMDIAPCLNCGECDDTGECVIEDDMAEIYVAIREADRIILASPIYFMGLSAQAKAMIDRCQAIWCERNLLEKPISRHDRRGLLLVVGGLEIESGAKCSNTTATAFFRSIGIPKHKALSFLGVDAKAEILKHATALKETYDAAAELMRGERG